jgi:hypothetical protein
MRQGEGQGKGGLRGGFLGRLNICITYYYSLTKAYSNYANGRLLDMHAEGLGCCCLQPTKGLNGY